jgi:hypothetical protein
VAEKHWRTGVLLLAGSSGALDQERARILTEAGVCAVPLRWFGGLGQQPGPFEVPLELFVNALDRRTSPVSSARAGRKHGLATTVVIHPRAGHRVVLPGEQPVECGQTMARGGGDRADAELGAAVWPAVLAALGVSSSRGAGRDG